VCGIVFNPNTNQKIKIINIIGIMNGPENTKVYFRVSLTILKRF